MIFELVSLASGRRIEYGLEDWLQLLDLASIHGWQPTGTIPPLSSAADEIAAQIGIDLTGGWNGHYVKARGQQVSNEDARAIGYALASALDDIPEREQEYDLMQPRELPKRHKPECICFPVELRGPLDVPAHNLVSPYAWFSGPAGRQKVATMVEFCTEGTFRIVK